jgi:hypothetical protein
LDLGLLLLHLILWNRELQLLHLRWWELGLQDLQVLLGHNLQQLESPGPSPLRGDLAGQPGYKWGIKVYDWRQCVCVALKFWSSVIRVIHGEIEIPLMQLLKSLRVGRGIVPV